MRGGAEGGGGSNASLVRYVRPSDIKKPRAGVTARAPYCSAFAFAGRFGPQSVIFVSSASIVCDVRRPSSIASVPRQFRVSPAPVTVSLPSAKFAEHCFVCCL
jgi:hypothetical protein